MIYIFLILLIAAFGQELEQPDCGDGTMLVDGGCQVDISLDCDPYDYECGVAVDRIEGWDQYILVLVSVMPFLISPILVVIAVLKWKKIK